MPTLWNDAVTWEVLERRFRDHGVRQVQVKFLTRNHNSKQQITGMGNDLAALGHLFPGEVTSHPATSGKPKSGPPIYHASLPWIWLTQDGISPAPDTKLIYYPQYPEIRLSGFLNASPNAPSALLALSDRPGSRGQEEGRCLVFGPGRNQQVFAAVVSRHSPAASFLQAFNRGRGTLVDVSLRADAADSRDVLFDALRRVHAKGWITPYRLLPDGSRAESKGPNSHGVTLESELGITANGRAAPDYLDWEIKAHRVAHLNAHLSSRITLLTPNPDFGPAKERGTTWLLQNYGKLDATNSRYDLSGIHKSGAVHAKTGLEFGVHGFDPASSKIVDDGYLYLRDPRVVGEIARWSFAKLLTHWQNKHSKAVFVPSIAGTVAPRQYMYGTRLHVGEGTTFLRFLNAVSHGSVVLDPGLNSELVGEGIWKAHTRYQFRTSLTNAGALYRSFEKVML